MTNLFLDEYEHCDTRLIYSSQNIPGPGADLDSFNCQITLKCECLGKCSDGCECLIESGVNYDSCGRLLGEKFSKNSAGVIECGTECTCGTTCGNRVVQRGPVSGLEVVSVGGKGLGLMRNQDLRRGDFICEYAGEVIGKNEAKLRAANSGDAMNYIFVLEEHTGQDVVETFVDPTCIGNIGRYINHSCNPNAIIVPVRFDSLEPHLAIFAVTDIISGCEITYSYSGGEYCSHGSNPCLCGENNCKKFIPFNPNLF